jgi:restriction system protein
MSLDPNAIPSLVPIWPEFVIPVLKVLEDGATLHRKDVFDAAADIADVSADGRNETLASGGSWLEQRVGWALSHLTKAGWVDRPSRGHNAINAEGRRSLEKYASGFDYALARDVFAPFWPKHDRGKSSTTVDDRALVAVEILDPIEQIEDGIGRIEDEVGEELLLRLRESHPDFFEQAVVDLLLKMGYGGAEQRGKRIGGPGDRLSSEPCVVSGRLAAYSSPRALSHPEPRPTRRTSSLASYSSTASASLP